MVARCGAMAATSPRVSRRISTARRPADRHRCDESILSARRAKPHPGNVVRPLVGCQAGASPCAELVGGVVGVDLPQSDTTGIGGEQRLVIRAERHGRGLSVSFEDGHRSGSSTAQPHATRMAGAGPPSAPAAPVHQPDQAVGRTVAGLRSAPSSCWSDRCPRAGQRERGGAADTDEHRGLGGGHPRSVRGDQHIGGQLLVALLRANRTPHRSLPRPVNPSSWWDVLACHELSTTDSSTVTSPQWMYHDPW